MGQSRHSDCAPMTSGLPRLADNLRAAEPAANLIAEARSLVRNRLFSSFQIHNSSLHCLSYADTLHERQRAWRGTELNRHCREDLPWLGSSCSLLACANPPGRSASNARKDSRACYPRSARWPPWWPVLDSSAWPLKSLPVGTAYAVWTGIGTIGTAALGIYL